MREVRKSSIDIRNPVAGTILKMPVPIDTEANRDEDFKQRVIDFEKRVLEPKLTQLMSSNPMSGQNVLVFGLTDKPDTFWEGFGSSHQAEIETKRRFRRNKINTIQGPLLQGYATGIGTNDIDEIFGEQFQNPSIVIDIIKEIYLKEGYTQINIHGSIGEDTGLKQPIVGFQNRGE